MHLGLSWAPRSQPDPNWRRYDVRVKKILGATVAELRLGCAMGAEPTFTLQIVWDTASSARMSGPEFSTESDGRRSLTRRIVATAHASSLPILGPCARSDPSTFVLLLCLEIHRRDHPHSRRGLGGTDFGRLGTSGLHGWTGLTVESAAERFRSITKSVSPSDSNADQARASPASTPAGSVLVDGRSRRVGLRADLPVNIEPFKDLDEIRRWARVPAKDQWDKVLRLSAASATSRRRTSTATTPTPVGRAPESAGSPTDVPAATIPFGVGAIVTQALAATHREPSARSTTNATLAERTYLTYRDLRVPLTDTPELAEYLARRYHREPVRLAGRAFPATVVWRNPDQLIAPDAILGDLDRDGPVPWTETVTLDEATYAAAREFIRTEYTKDEVKEEGTDYVLRDIELRPDALPRIHAGPGRYYDNILTQYAMEFELRKAAAKLTASTLDALSTSGSLPLREAVEGASDPVLHGAGRCAAMTVSTLLVFRMDAGLCCMLRRRSTRVGVSPGMLHVIPAGMFEAPNVMERWSVAMNVWRELLEEVYGEKEFVAADGRFGRRILLHEPVRTAVRLIERGDGSAELSVTGICCDLLNLRTEICTVLYVNDLSFIDARAFNTNWEYEPAEHAALFATPMADLDHVVERYAADPGIVPTAAACIMLGRDWLRARHGLA